MSDAAAELEAAMAEALHGSRPAAQFFFERLREADLFVPERYQAQRLSNAPAYPNDFINILGVQDGARTVVPAFLRAEYAAQWCGAPLSCKALSFGKLAEMLPPEWWLVINPGRDAEKELSPWEIERLRAGPEGTAEVLEEIFAPELAELLEVRALAADEHPALGGALRRAAEGRPAVARVHLLKQLGTDADGAPSALVLIGVEAPAADAAAQEDLRRAFADAARPALIGDCPVRVLVSEDIRNSPAIGLFRDAPPLYVRRRGWRERLKRLWQGRTGRQG